MIELIEWEDPVIHMGNLGKIIKVLRTEMNMSQEQLALEAGLSQYTVFAIEHGRNIQMASALMMLDALDRELVIRRKR